MTVNPFKAVIKPDVVLTFRVVRGIKKIWVDTSVENGYDLDDVEKLALRKEFLKYVDKFTLPNS